MHVTPRLRLPGILFLATACLSASAQTSCSATATAIATASAQVAEIQHHLSAIKLQDMDTDVPPSLQQETTLLKQSLATAVQAVLACQPLDAQPAALKTALATALKANAPEPENATFPWGGDLRVTVDQTSIPHLLRVRVGYAIECGEDTMLLLFAPEQGHWSNKLVWQSPAYKDDSGAFGDFFLTTLLPGSTPDDWRVVVAHGKPWCTSRFSGFGIDILAPTSDPAHPQILWHTDRGYSRGDFVPSLKSSNEIFEFRINEDAMSFDIDNAFERTVIYRYRLTGNTVTRLEPIATNGRGFVEEWLSMPWPEAKDQSLPTNTEPLQRIHHLYEASDPKDSNTYTSWTAGPVRSCSTAGHFQVAFDSQLNKIVPAKPGGDQDPPVHYYFQIKQIANGYEMEAVSRTPDPTCHGPDLMAKPAAKPR
jgi:hypothetical protein